MTKEELKEQDIRLNKLCFDYQEKEKQIEIDAEHIRALQKQNGELTDKVRELEEKISVLLSCKNCPENKGGYICQKEYENKCLAQKIEYIKELQQENADLEKENAELKNQLEMSNKVYNDNLDYSHHIEEQLTKAKEIIKNLLILKNDHYGNTKMEWRVKVTEQAEQFLNSEVEK